MTAQDRRVDAGGNLLGRLIAQPVDRRGRAPASTADELLEAFLGCPAASPSQQNIALACPERVDEIEIVVRPLDRPDLGWPPHAWVRVHRPLHPEQHVAARPAGGVAECGMERWTFLAERHLTRRGGPNRRSSFLACSLVRNRGSSAMVDLRVVG